jgi:subtilisin family serine protease
VAGNQTGRRVPPVTAFSNLGVPELSTNAVPLPEAETLTDVNFHRGRFGRIQIGPQSRLFNQEMVLVKFRHTRHVAALRVEPLRELDAVRALRQRKDVEFAELDLFQERQFVPQDPFLSNQWHHAVIGSFEAWRYSLGESSVRIAIVDTPFQMDHPDLAPHTDAGWDVIDGVSITSASGIDHSTISAGMAAAVIDNGIGGAGASNCRILPININGAISEMYDAIIWAADHDVRVVNISWTGGNSDVLNWAGSYLKQKSRGILAMPGVNGAGFLDYTNQPNIYCVSMTDAADNPRSRFGNHIDFSAPGFEIFSTTTNSNYAYASGTSFSTPLFCGVVATLFSINPALSPDAAIDLLKITAVDLGSAGWDQFYGFGRINFGAAAAAAQASRLAITRLEVVGGQRVLTITNAFNQELILWKRSALETSWERVANAVISTNAGFLTLTDPSAAETAAFYRVEARLP